jgi:hypothetical protein
MGSTVLWNSSTGEVAACTIDPPRSKTQTQNAVALDRMLLANPGYVSDREINGLLQNTMSLLPTQPIGSRCALYGETLSRFWYKIE